MGGLEESIYANNMGISAILTCVNDKYALFCLIYEILFCTKFCTDFRINISVEVPGLCAGIF